MAYAYCAERATMSSVKCEPTSTTKSAYHAPPPPQTFPSNHIKGQHLDDRIQLDSANPLLITYNKNITTLFTHKNAYSNMHISISAEGAR